MSETNKVDRSKFVKIENEFKKGKDSSIYVYRSGKLIGHVLDMESVLPDLEATHLGTDKYSKHKEKYCSIN